LTIIFFSISTANLRLSFFLFFGGDGGGDTPVSIPNTEVKPSSADGTALVTEWESRTPPEFFTPFFVAIMKKGFFFELANDQWV
jgi:hypothetical protein